MEEHVLFGECDRTDGPESGACTGRCGKGGEWGACRGDAGKGESGARAGEMQKGGSDLRPRAREHCLCPVESAVF